MCTNCLGFHNANQCSSQSKCKTCQRKHHTLLHNDTIDSNKQVLLSHLESLQAADQSADCTMLNPEVEAFKVTTSCNATSSRNDSFIFVQWANEEVGYYRLEVKRFDRS